MPSKGTLLAVSVLIALPSLVSAQRPQRYVPADSLSPEELVREWEAEMSRPTSRARPVRASGRTDAIAATLENHRANPARAAAIRGELERVALHSQVPDAQCLAILTLTSGYRVDIPAERAQEADTRQLAERLHRIYTAIGGNGYTKRCVLSAVTSLGGSGRHAALIWLEPLIVGETSAESFPGEAFEAMRTAVGLGAPGRALVIRLRDGGLIKDSLTRFRASFITLGGGPS